MQISILVSLVASSVICASASVAQQALDPLEPMDVFQLELAADPQISPDGSEVIYVRRHMDVMADVLQSELWRVGRDGQGHQPLGLAGTAVSPRWSPNGDRLAYVSLGKHGRQIFVRWMDSGASAQVTRLQDSPSDLAWSPDGRWLAFTMDVPAETESLVAMPAKPEGASWAPAAVVVDSLTYRRDGEGTVKPAHRQVFIVPAEGGTPRQLTKGTFQHQGPLVWQPDAKALIFVANRRGDAELEPNDTDLWKVELADGSLHHLVERFGPDNSPAISPDGRTLAWLGYAETLRPATNARIWVRPIEGGEARCLSEGLDVNVDSLAFDGRGSLIYTYDLRGDTQLARVGLEGEHERLSGGLGGLSFGRPYPAANVHAGQLGDVVFTSCGVHRPADLELISAQGTRTRLTRLNDDWLGQRKLGEVRERWTNSSYDGQKIHSWTVYPPDFDPEKSYPMILEIHGGPFANYGPRFSLEMQLYAAAGFVVVYANPRGSTSYGQAFAQEIHHAYPSQDYDDLMSVVDAVLAEGQVDSERLYVTGGSGGGVLTAWIVGKTDRFRAAVVAKPVIHWTSFVLTADAYAYFARWWFGAMPWEDPRAYWSRSPLSLVGEVSTPVMLLTGEADYRTPISETEQYYQALKLRGIESAMVRLPGASHGIASRPSRLISKVLHVLAWFDRYR